MSWPKDAYAYLTRHRDYVRRDLDTLRREQAAAERIARLERNLAHLDALLEAYPGDARA